MSKRAMLSAVLLTLGLAAGPLTARGVGATFSTCNTDPTVVLSNGVTVNMAATIGTDPSMVTGVTYVLHAPRGTTMTGISYDTYGYLETVQFVADQDSGTYLIDTEAFTATSLGASVTAQASVTGLGSSQRSGSSFQHLYMRFGGGD